MNHVRVYPRWSGVSEIEFEFQKLKTPLVSCREAQNG